MVLRVLIKLVGIVLHCFHAKSLPNWIITFLDKEIRTLIKAGCRVSVTAGDLVFLGPAKYLFMIQDDLFCLNVTMEKVEEPCHLLFCFEYQTIFLHEFKMTLSSLSYTIMIVVTWFGLYCLVGVIAGTTEAVRPSERRTLPLLYLKLWGKSLSWRKKILPLWNGSSPIMCLSSISDPAAPCKSGQG